MTTSRGKKVLGRKDYSVVYLVNRLPKEPFREMVMVKDFSNK